MIYSLCWLILKETSSNSSIVTWFSEFQLQAKQSEGGSLFSWYYLKSRVKKNLWIQTQSSSRQWRRSNAQQNYPIGRENFLQELLQIKVMIRMWHILITYRWWLDSLFSNAKLWNGPVWQKYWHLFQKHFPSKQINIVNVDFIKSTAVMRLAIIHDICKNRENLLGARWETEPVHQGETGCGRGVLSLSVPPLRWSKVEVEVEVARFDAVVVVGFISTSTVSILN